MSRAVAARNGGVARSTCRPYVEEEPDIRVDAVRWTSYTVEADVQPKFADWVCEGCGVWR